MVRRVCAIYGIMLVMRAITTSVSTKDPTSPTLYVVCPYLVSAGVWKSRGDFLPTLDHCGVVIFRFYTAIFLSKSTMSFTRVMLGSEKQGSTPITQSKHFISLAIPYSHI